MFFTIIAYLAVEIEQEIPEFSQLANQRVAFTFLGAYFFLSSFFIARMTFNNCFSLLPLFCSLPPLPPLPCGFSAPWPPWLKVP
ncbi:hypothetical protein LX36DRAFT_408128 [Colletotrichum falcatum]|nr:hypothetical protein LX36DRAFT_408128 [Colletotrichum falcatum]